MWYGEKDKGVAMPKNDKLEYWDRIVGEEGRGLKSEDAYEIGVTTVALAFGLLRDHTPLLVEASQDIRSVAKLSFGTITLRPATGGEHIWSVRRGNSSQAEHITFMPYPDEPITLEDAERMAVAADTACAMVEEAYIGADRVIAATRERQSERLGLEDIPFGIIFQDI